MKGNTLKRRLVKILGESRRELSSVSVATCAELIHNLPVDAKQAPRQRVLIKGLRSIDREILKACRRIDRAAVALERLAVKNEPVKNMPIP